MLQRIALYATLGYLLDALAIGFTHWGFWCILGLFIASEHLTRMEIIEQLQQELEALQKRIKDIRDQQQ